MKGEGGKCPKWVKRLPEMKCLSLVFCMYLIYNKNKRIYSEKQIENRRFSGDDPKGGNRMTQTEYTHDFVKIDTYVLGAEDLRAFYPLLPEEHRKTDLDEEFAILGAVGTDTEGVQHACGVMVLKIVREDMLLLRWMLVAPACQRQGIGYALMDLAQGIAEEMQMQIVGNFSQKVGEGKDGAVYRFMKHNDFSIYAEGAKSYSVPLGRIGEEDFFQRDGRSKGIITMAEASSVMIMAMNRELMEKGLLFIGPVSKEDILADVSLVEVVNGEIQSCVIFREINEKTVELAFVYTDSKGSVKMPLMLIQAYHLLKEKYPAETELVIPCVTDSSCKLVETLAPSAEVTLTSYSVQWMPNKGLE